MNAEFTIYPAIDLRAGQVVRLVQGDPQRQTVYGDNPAEMARRWLQAGAQWLHLVNLDGAFGEGGAGAANPGPKDVKNWTVIQQVTALAAGWPGQKQVQVGGGVRSLAEIEKLLGWGVRRAIVGTLAVEQPELLVQAGQQFGFEHLALALDARQGRVQVRGWQADGGREALELAQHFATLGGRTVIYTDVLRDGGGQGLDIALARLLVEETGLEVIGSGGVGSLEDVRRARQAGLSGVIIGKALYDGRIALQEALEC